MCTGKGSPFCANGVGVVQMAKTGVYYSQSECDRLVRSRLTQRLVYILSKAQGCVSQSKVVSKDLRQACKKEVRIERFTALLVCTEILETSKVGLGQRRVCCRNTVVYLS